MHNGGHRNNSPSSLSLMHNSDLMKAFHSWTISFYQKWHKGIDGEGGGCSGYRHRQMSYGDLSIICLMESSTSAIFKTKVTGAMFKAPHCSPCSAVFLDMTTAFTVFTAFIKFLPCSHSWSFGKIYFYIYGIWQILLSRASCSYHNHNLYKHINLSKTIQKWPFSRCICPERRTL